jgi:hypothetical protein
LLKYPIFFSFSNISNPVTKVKLFFHRGQLVIDRRMAQGGRSVMGRQWNAGIWTGPEPCRKQRCSAWKFLQNSLSTNYFQTPEPDDPEAKRIPDSRTALTNPANPVDSKNTTRYYRKNCWFWCGSDESGLR